MPANVEIALHAFVILLMPLAVFSLFARTLPVDNTILGKVYRADPRLLVVNNLFLLSLGCVSIGKVGLHFGFIDAALKSRVETFTQVPFMIMLVVSLTFLIRAFLKVRREANAGA